MKSILFGIISCYYYFLFQLLLIAYHHHGAVDAFSTSSSTLAPPPTKSNDVLADVDDVMINESSHYDDDDQCYHQYTKYQRSSPLDQAGGIMYRQSVFTKEEFDIIQKEVQALTTSTKSLTKEKSSIAVDRLGVTLSPKTSQTVQILQNGSLYKLIQRLTAVPKKISRQDDNDDDTLELSFDLPVEVRVYEIEGSGMSWHVDDVLYKPKPQLEVVITLENNSDCVTMWKKKDNMIYSQETDPNSVLILKAGGPLHCVTSLKRGKRTILKCAYAYRQSQFCNDQGSTHKQNQFGSSSGSSVSSNKQKKNNKKGKKSKR